MLVKDYGAVTYSYKDNYLLFVIICLYLSQKVESMYMDSINCKNSMSKILFYTTGDLATKHLTGGIKRFMELVRYGFSTNRDVVLSSRTNTSKLQELGVKNT